MEKDMSSVERYAMEDKLKFLRGMCFNNASILLAGALGKDAVKLVSVGAVFDYAKALFDEAVKRDWVNYGSLTDNRSINKDSGKVEVPLEKKGTMENSLTEQDDIGQNSDTQTADETDGVVI